MTLQDLLEMLWHVRPDILPASRTIDLLATSKTMKLFVANMQRVVFIASPPRVSLTNYSEYVETMINCVKKNTFLCKMHITLKVFLEEDEAQQLATALCTNTTVSGLVLRTCDLSDEACQSLASALLTNTTLVSIDLCGNRLNDGGCAALKNALSVNTTLCFLDLRYNFLTESNRQMLVDCRTPWRKILL
jgi:hypothetical protein